MRDAEQLADRTTLTGQPLAPLLPATSAVWHQGLLDAEHLRVIQKFFRDLPDHVATELGFMAHLASQEAEAQPRDALAWLDRERAFLRDHLVVWLPRFCQRVREASRHPFYSALAELTVTFVNLDMEWIETHYTNSNPRERLNK